MRPASGSAAPLDNISFFSNKSAGPRDLTVAKLSANAAVVCWKFPVSAGAQGYRLRYGIQQPTEDENESSINSSLELKITDNAPPATDDASSDRNPPPRDICANLKQLEAETAYQVHISAWKNSGGDDEIAGPPSAKLHFTTQTNRKSAPRQMATDPSGLDGSADDPSCVNLQKEFLIAQRFLFQTKTDGPGVGAIWINRIVMIPDSFLFFSLPVEHDVQDGRVPNLPGAARLRVPLPFRPLRTPLRTFRSLHPHALPQRSHLRSHCGQCIRRRTGWIPLPMRRRMDCG